jgi:DNA-binding SARP family transcriptional activator
MSQLEQENPGSLKIDEGFKPEESARFIKGGFLPPQKPGFPETVLQLKIDFEKLKLEGNLSASEYGQAADKLEAAGCFEDAIELYEAAADWASASRLIVNNALSLWSNGKEKRLKLFLHRLPNDFLSKDPWLLYWMGACTLPEDPLASQDYFELAHNRFQSQGDISGSLSAGAGMIESSLLTSGWNEQLQWLVDRLKAILCNPACESLRPEVEAGAVPSLLLVSVLISPEGSDAVHLNERCRKLLKTAIPVFLKLKLYSALIIFFTLRGELVQAQNSVRHLQPLLSSPVAPPSARAMGVVAKGFFQLVSGHSTKCQNLLQANLRGFKKHNQKVCCRLAHMLCDASLLMSGNLRIFNVLSAETERFSGNASGFGWEKPATLAINSFFQKAKGNLDDAALYMDDALHHAANLRIPYLEALVRLAKSTLALYREMQKEGLQDLDAAEAIAGNLTSPLLRFNVLLVRTAFQTKEPQGSVAVQILEQALALGRRHGIYNPFFIDRLNLKAICIKALESGIEEDYVRQLIKRFRFSARGVPAYLKNWPWFLEIITMGSFTLVKKGQLVKFGRKAQRKPLQMLRLVLALGGSQVAEERVVDALWPEADGDMGHRSFSITLHRLRRLLGSSKVIELHNGCITLEKDYCWVDAWAFESLCNKAGGFWKYGKTEEELNKAVEMSCKAMALYRGSFFSSLSDEPWTLVSRDRLRNKYLNLAGKLAAHWQRCQSMDLALECYQRCIEEEPIDEEPYFNLMVYYRQLGRREKALAVYTRHRDILSSVYGIEPSEQIKKLRMSILNDSKS